MSKQIRNIAIIAHVDHGKTTMVDQLLRQSGTFAEHEKVVDTVMDNHAIERERGITILAKNCAVSWKDTHINISTRPVTRTSAAKWNAPCPWSTAWCC
jgi:GTP-binding protein